MSKFKTPPKPSLEVQLNGWKIITAVLAFGYFVIWANTYIFGGAA